MRIQVTCRFALALMLAAHSLAYADEGSKVCDAVLAGDMMNRVSTSKSAQASSRQYWDSVLLSLHEDEAFRRYESTYDAIKKQRQAGSAEGHYAVIGGSGSFDVAYERRLSSAEFSKVYRKAREEQRSSSKGGSESSTSLISNFASNVRDATSIEAWKACVTRNEVGLFAFGSRDETGTPFVNVVWAPGQFAGLVPSIPVQFVATTANTKLEVDKADIAVGSGRTFRIVATDLKRSFSVKINGTILQAGKVAGSFAASATVPALLEPQKPMTFSLKGVWRNVAAGGDECLLRISQDDAKNFQGDCDGQGHRHHFSGVYTGPDQINFIVKRTDPTGCPTQSNGTIRFIGKDELAMEHNSYQGCNISTKPIAIRLVRVE